MKSCGTGQLTPCARSKPDYLPGQVRRQHEEPCGRLSAAKFFGHSAVKVAVAISAVFAEDQLPDQVDAERQDEDTDEQQSEKQPGFTNKRLPEIRVGLCHDR